MSLERIWRGREVCSGVRSQAEKREYPWKEHAVFITVVTGTRNQSIPDITTICINEWLNVRSAKQELGMVRIRDQAGRWGYYHKMSDQSAAITCEFSWTQCPGNKTRSCLVLGFFFLAKNSLPTMNACLTQRKQWSLGSFAVWVLERRDEMIWDGMKWDEMNGAWS